MNIIIAKSAGFCMGVRRALSATLNIAKQKQKIYTFGPLIHNPQVIKLLEEKNIKTAKSLDQVEKGSTLIIRTHGISPKQYLEIKNKELTVCDETCPHVIKVQKIIKKYTEQGYTTIIIGDKGHAEVIGLLGFAGDNGIVIETIDDLKKLSPHIEKACVVAQTTQEKAFFFQATKYLKDQINNLKIFDTICNATDKRQSEAKNLAQTMEAVIVVGGKNSANTTRLYEIAKKINPNTFFIEDEKNLSLDSLKNFKSIGITAGASTPHWMIKQIATKINTLNQLNKSSFSLVLSQIINFIFASELSVGLGAASLSLASCLAQKITFTSLFMLISFFYILAMHIFNNLNREQGEKIKGSPKTTLYKNYKKTLLSSAGISVLFSLILAFSISYTAFFLILSFTFLGIVYNVKIIPENLFQNLSYKKIKDLPGSKDIFTALGWTTIIVIFPIITDIKHNFSYASIVIGIFIFLSVFLRTILLDIKDIQNDMLIGKETLPVLLGEYKTKKIINYLISFIIIMLLISIFTVKGMATLALLLLILPFYFIMYLWFFIKKSFINEFFYEILIDSSFILVGIVSFTFWYFFH